MNVYFLRVPSVLVEGRRRSTDMTGLIIVLDART
jgi:hypothetical protein